QADGTVTVGVVNPSAGPDGCFGVYIRYDSTHLPRFTQWKQMGEQEYVVGLEPCNCGVQGRAVDESQGLLHVLDPGERREYRFEFGPIVSASQAEALRALAHGVEPTFVDSYKAFVKPPA